MARCGSKTESEKLSDLALQCATAARSMSYDNSETEARAKHLLLEASDLLDRHSVNITHARVCGHVVVDARGDFRVLTLRERLAYWIMGKTSIIP